MWLMINFARDLRRLWLPKHRSLFFCAPYYASVPSPPPPPLLASAEGCAVLPCAPETKYLKNTCVQKLIVDFIAMNRSFRVVGGQLYLTWTLPLHAVSLRMLLSFLFKNFFSCMSKSYFFLGFESSNQCSTW